MRQAKQRLSEAPVLTARINEAFFATETADAARPRHQIGRPVSCLGRWIGERQSHHAFGHFRTERGIREGRVLSRRRPSMPSSMNRSCQRQTQVFDLAVRRMMSLVPTPALSNTIAARKRASATRCCRW